MQLLQAYTPQATLMLGVLVPLCEQVSKEGEGGQLSTSGGGIRPFVLNISLSFWAMI